MAKIGIVIHGPEVIDSGWALRLINCLSRFGQVEAVLGGTMGRVAVIDAGLESVVNISQRKMPSASLRDMSLRSDILALLNEAKSRQTGIAFGAEVSARSGVDKPLIQIDSGGKFVSDLSFSSSGMIASCMIGEIARDLGFEILAPAHVQSVFREGDSVRRSLTGVQPGECISINGTVVGRATGCEVEIMALGGKIARISGAVPKQHGINKLPPLDLEAAVVRSGSIRRTSAEVRDLSKERSLVRTGQDLVLIDHCAEGAFEAAVGAAAAVTVGDDTTAVAGDILSRLGIPVLGVVDGDLDCLHSCASAEPHPGSVMIRVEPGFDDLVGRKIRDEIFCGGHRATLCVGTCNLVERITDIAGEHLVCIERR